jgi:hypothetical protein
MHDRGIASDPAGGSWQRNLASPPLFRSTTLYPSLRNLSIFKGKPVNSEETHLVLLVKMDGPP